MGWPRALAYDILQTEDRVKGGVAGGGLDIVGDLRRRIEKRGEEKRRRWGL